MADSPIPAPLRGIVRSVWTLELILLMKSDASRLWSPSALVQELRGSSSLVDQNLERLTGARIVSQTEDGYIYRPDPVMRDACDALEVSYRARPVAVINAIASGVASLQTFADAFKFKRDET